ncbi:unnamed protein product [Blepharisma stoltei]|uniref:Uncharacterized protein n=1 Tax=Blepharisma stoltei TaxID=1481888 RepID=A0AAU9JVE9_9CILI|nr:unnamed protein product [Blepharisma stoltei]
MLFSIESTIEKHKKIIKEIVDNLANIKDSISKMIKEYENCIKDLEGIKIINENRRGLKGPENVSKPIKKA